MPELQAYLNGKWIPASAATVPAIDAGFVQGAAVAEQLRTFAGKLFRLDEHLARLMRSLEIVGVDPGMSSEAFARIACELAARNHSLLAPGDDLGLTIFVTPGTYSAYAAQDDCRHTVCLHTYSLPFHLWANKYRDGQALVTTRIRQVPPECWPAQLKCRSRMHYYLADREATAADPSAKALLLDTQGFVTETATANLLIFNEGEGLVSPPAEKTLHGISLSITLELAERLGISHARRDLTIEDVARAGEAMLCSTPTCLLPVVRLNDRPIGTGRPGKVFGDLLAAWNDIAGVDLAAQANQKTQP